MLGIHAHHIQRRQIGEHCKCRSKRHRALSPKVVVLLQIERERLREREREKRERERREPCVSLHLPSSFRLSLKQDWKHGTHFHPSQIKDSSLPRALSTNLATENANHNIDARSSQVTLAHQLKRDQIDEPFHCRSKRRRALSPNLVVVLGREREESLASACHCLRPFSSLPLLPSLPLHFFPSLPRCFAPFSPPSLKMLPVSIFLIIIE